MIAYSEIEYFCPNLFHLDDSHLSVVVNDLFLADLQRGLLGLLHSGRLGS